MDVDGVVSHGSIDQGSKGLVQDVGSSSDDAGESLVVTKGSIATMEDGSLVQVITVTPNPEPPAPDGGTVFIAQTVDVGPFGATISSPMKLTLGIDTRLFAAGTDVSKLTIARFDSKTSTWIPVKSTVDGQTNTVLAEIDVFGTYAVMGPEPSRVGTLVRYILLGILAVLALFLFLFLLNKRSIKLVFASPPQDITAGKTSNFIVVQTERASGKVITARRDIILDLSSTSATGTYDLVPTGVFDVATKTVVLRKGEQTASFYYKDSTPGIATMTVAIAGRSRVRATQQITVKSQ